MPNEPTWEESSPVDVVPTWDQSEPVSSGRDWMGNYPVSGPMPETQRVQRVIGGQEIPRSQEELDLQNLQRRNYTLPEGVEEPLSLLDRVVDPIANRITPQMAQNAIDLFGNLTTGGMMGQPLEGPNTPPGTAAQIAAGAQNLATSTTSPLALGSLGAGLLPGAATKAVSGGFLADTAYHLPQVSQAAGQASVDGSLADKIESYGGLALAGLAGPGMALHVRGSPSERAIAQAGEIIRDAPLPNVDWELQNLNARQGEFQPLPPTEVNRIKLARESIPMALESGLNEINLPSGFSPVDRAIAERRFGPSEQQTVRPREILPVERPTPRQDIEGGQASFRRGAEQTASTVPETSIEALRRPDPEVLAPLPKEVRQTFAQRLQNRDFVAAIDELQGQPAEVSQKIIDNIVGVGRKKVGLKAAEATIFSEIWDRAVARKLAEEGPTQKAQEAVPATTPEIESLWSRTKTAADNYIQESQGRSNVGIDPVLVGAYAVKAAALIESGAIKTYEVFKKEFDERYPEAKEMAKDVWDRLNASDDAIFKEIESSKGAAGLNSATGKFGGSVTSLAYRVGARTDTPAKLERLKRGQAEARAEAMAAAAEGKFDEALAISMKSQFFREAAEYATGTASAGSYQVSRMPGYEPPLLDRAARQNIVDQQRARDVALEPGTKQSIYDWAEKTLKDSDGKIGSGVDLDPRVFAAHSIRLARLLEQGAVKFKDWSVDMVKQYGPAIRPQLENIWREALISAKGRTPSAQKTSTTATSGAAVPAASRGGPSGGAATPASNPVRAVAAGAAGVGAPLVGGGQVQRPAGGAGAPPVGGGQVTRPAGGAGGGVSLDDVYRIFEPAPKPGSSIGQMASKTIEAVRTGVSSKFRPLDKLAEDIAKTYGVNTPKGISGIFEQLKGSSGKGEADVYRFDRAVSDLVKGSEKDFNAYMFLRRSLDRLEADARTGETRRKVAGFTLPGLQARLQLLNSRLSPEQLSAFPKAADAYQQHLDQALQLQVESGRMSIETYAEIKKGNQFYAPFKVMKYLEETTRPSGTGARVDTAAKYTKAMEGIESPDFKLGDMLAAGRQNLLLSRILAEKNTAMRRVADMAPFDTQGTFIRKLKPNEEVSIGEQAVNVFEGGVQERYVVPDNVAEAIQIYQGTTTGELVTRMLGAGSSLFRAGATTANLPFQFSNLMADLPRTSLISKYGITNPVEAVRFPIELGEAILSSVSGNVFGIKNKLFLDFLDSGAAGTTISEYLRPEALQFKVPDAVSKSKKLSGTVLNTINDFAQAFEQTSKILGVKRAMRFEGASSGAELAKRIPEAITELRRFSGSPDFGRIGKWTEQTRANLLLMFLNARIQGNVSDVGRLLGRDGSKRAAVTATRLGLAVGLPTALLYLMNTSDKYAADYAKRSEQEKQNYWLIPKDTFITTEDGERMRDYWRIPKREAAKMTANATESTLQFAERRDPQQFGKWAGSMIEDISPVNIQGKNLPERMESVASGLNPVLKMPLEVATGRDLYRHRSIVPEAQKKASPENQYTDRTSEVFKKLAQAMPDVAPEVMRSPLMLENMTKNLTAGLVTQFLPQKPVAGRSGIENTPLLQRFQALPFSDQAKTQEQIRGLEREAADESLARHRLALKALEGRSSVKEAAKELVRLGGDEKAMEHMVDLYVANKNGITQQERQILGLPVRQRAMFIADQIKGLSAEAKREKLKDYAKKRILSEGVAEELLPMVSE